MFYLLMMCLVHQIITVSGSVLSKYTQTMVVHELESCTLIDINRGVQKKTHSAIECGKLCSNTNDCRRFMFDRGDMSCTLYDSGENCIASNVDRKVCYKQNYVCDENSCQKCPVGYYGNKCEHIITDCHDGLQKGFTSKKILAYTKPSNFGPVVEVICSFQRSITYILNRDLACQQIDFNRTWKQYTDGFGYGHGNYWMGLKNIFNFLQIHTNVNFQVILQTYSGLTYRAYYHKFKLSDESQDFKLQLSGFADVSSPTITGDSLTKAPFNIDDNVFSTYDRDHTVHQCPQRFAGGGWYVNSAGCSRANLFGKSQGFGAEDNWNWMDTKREDRNFTLIQILCRVY